MTATEQKPKSNWLNFFRWRGRRDADVARPWTDFDFVNCDAEALFAKLGTSSHGLTHTEAALRLKAYGRNEPARHRREGAIAQLAGKFANPLVLVLVIIAILSFSMGERVSVAVIVAMILLSVIIGFVQEYRSGREAERLIAMVRTTATVYRDGRPKEIPIGEIVPGDVIDLSAGAIVPADLRIITCRDLYVNQSALTGESFPSEKCAVVVPGPVATFDHANVAYMGTSVVSGSALGVVIKTGAATQFGQVAGHLSARRPETSFERGVKQFSYLMIKAIIVMVVFIFAVIALTKGVWMEAILFSLAVAVGLTPEMLPTIVAVNLTKGATAMAKRRVIVKHLNSIQNFGAMDVFCTDKTGTLTQDEVALIRHCDVTGRESEAVLDMVWLNSHYETGLKNLLDRAVLKHDRRGHEQGRKVDEIPFDFQRRVMSVVVDIDGQRRLVSKGAPEEIFKRCAHFELDGRIQPTDGKHLPALLDELRQLNEEGFRVLAVAYRDFPVDREAFSAADEADLTLKGYIAFLDPPKPTAAAAVASLQELGVRLKVLSGDNAIVTRKVCREVGIGDELPITGDDVDRLDDAALALTAEKNDVFARLSPLQKERVIKALQSRGHVVGYLGDGINDAASLKVADVGISVNNAVDIAKESAELILLEKDLGVLRDGVTEGRRVFGNIVKYVRMGASSNFGNMLSMTGAALFLPFVPMAPVQVLLNNFLYDVSQVAIPTDNVDEEYVKQPRGWNIAGVKRFMLIIGPVSSVFDFLTFGIGLWVFHAPVGLFRTFWFMESLCTQTLIIHVIRTAKTPWVQSRPSLFLTLTSVFVIAAGIIIPNSRLGQDFGFVPPPLKWYPVLLALLVGYVFMTEAVKRRFVKKYGYG